MVLSRPFLAAWIVYACIAWVSCTACNNDIFCTETPFVTGRCDGTNCICKDTAKYRPIATGCGDRAEIAASWDSHKPNILYSGNITDFYHAETSSNVDLDCVTTYPGQGPITYKWFLNARTVISGGTVSVISGGTVSGSASSGGGTGSANSISAGVVVSGPAGSVSSNMSISGSSVSSGSSSSVSSSSSTSVSSSSSTSVSSGSSTSVSSGSSTSVTTGSVISGATGRTYSAPAPTSGSVEYRCQVIAGRSYVSEQSGPFVISRSEPAENGIEKVGIVSESRFPLLNSYTFIKCLVCAGSLENLKYSWTFNGEPILGQHDSTLQIKATRFNSGYYSCSVTLNGSYKVRESSYRKITFRNEPIAPILSSSYYFFENHLYELECRSYSWTQGMTFELIDGVTGARLQTSSSGIFMVNATAVAKFYRCASLFNGIKKESRYNITVQGKDARAVGISGPREWEVGVPATLKCETVSLNNTKISYQWLKKVLDSTPLPGETGETLTVTSPKAEFAQYTCLVTTPGGTKDEASVEFSVVQDLSTPPYVSYDARPLNLGGRYTLECHSNFGETAVTYKWTKDGVVLPSTSNNYVIPSMAAKDAGKYSCSVTVNGKTLEAKNPFEVDTPGAKGKACKAALFTATCSGEEYTGNCLAGRCECSPGAELQQNGCALSVASSAPTVVSDVTTAMNLGGRYILICASTASVTGATYTWTKDGQTLPYTSATLEIPSMSLTDVGEYACRITVNGNTSPQAAAFSVRPRAVQPGQPVTDDPNPGTRVSVSLLVFTVTLLCGLVVRQET